MAQGRSRVVIENLKPEVDGGRFAIKRVVGEKVVVTADVFGDGHDAVAARLQYKIQMAGDWREAAMKFVDNDRWQGEFIVEEPGIYLYTVTAWVDHFLTWQSDLRKRFEAGQDLRVDLLIGVEHVLAAASRAGGDDRSALLQFAETLKRERGHDYAVAVALGEELSLLMEKYPDRRFASRHERELQIVVDRKRALFSTWYERFPRSCSPVPGQHGTFKDCEALLPEIARMGFDILYLPPIHPIGITNRKGKNNVPSAGSGEVGSPWAIGAAEGGHMSIHPQLGTLQDFRHLVQKAAEHGIEIAMDLAYQCTPDHPYVKEHPEWFRRRPDGSIQYAENPPKKYQDIFPFNFETEHWQELWQELKSIVLYWIEQGVLIFRVDNPHTKPFAFWEWLITAIKRDHPEVIFLSEAFTRPKVMYRLAKLGFTQSYTYFTWRSTKREFIDYLTELTQSYVRDFFRSNFWPNTPDILPEHLQYGGRPAFMMRLVLAATLSSNYGIYGPAFELCLSQALPGREEYLDSEKYEVKAWDWDAPGNLKDFIARMNRIRHQHPALQATTNLKFHEVDNEQLLFYSKATPDHADIILVVVNLDPFHTHAGWVKVPVREFGIAANQPYLVHDLLSDDRYIWHGERNYIELNPQVLPAHVFQLKRRLQRETDFDYFL